MSKKRPGKGKSRKQKGAGPRFDQPAETAAQRTSRTRPVTPVTLGLGLAVVVLGAALLWGWRDGGNAALPRDDGSTTLPSTAVPATAKPAVVGLGPAPPGTKTPINHYDPATGEPINANSPTITYKGYVVAFCCENSPGYKGRWAAMTEAAKDEFVRRFLK